MKLAEFITSETTRIISEWEQFAKIYLPAARHMDLEGRRDHVAGMLLVIADDLAKPQTKGEQASKSKGQDDAEVESATAANAHGTDRAATGFSPSDVVSEFRALRASVLRLWSEAQDEFSRENLEEVTRFNEAIDQLLVESMTRYSVDVDRSKDLLLGVLGHDLRTPLGAIMMSATVLLTQEGADWPHAKTVSRILNAGTRMDGMIGDLVDLTRERLGSGIPIARTQVELEVICQQTVDELAAFYPHCQFDFEATGDLRGSWDGGRIAQALSNLCGNAIQHGTKHEPIAVRLRGEADEVALSVRNRGREIPKDQLEEIFSPFARLDPARAAPRDDRSIGLGLYIVRAIVSAHQGTIEVTSSADGTTFTIHLPRHVAVAGPAPETAPQ